MPISPVFQYPFDGRICLSFMPTGKSPGGLCEVMLSIRNTRLQARVSLGLVPPPWLAIDAVRPILEPERVLCSTLSANLLTEEQLSILNGGNSFTIPKDVVADTSEKVCARASSLNNADLRSAILFPKDLIH
jgi:hypothetical protein